MAFQAAGTEFKVNATSVSTATITSPVVATAANGDFVVVWKFPYSSSDSDLKFRRFNANGTPKDIVDGTIAGETNNEYQPAVAMKSDGSFVVAYVRETSGNQDVLVRRFDANGNLIGSEIAVATSDATKNQFDPAIAMDAAGNFCCCMDARVFCD
ncbi:MAG: hypothetical protein HC895_11055 [Leptolyngbyaceae cyanobacterium SM1_3_5]|nr:hypothetical protein [Leptolyngbyaceae cyanobacterium SM1_3_5]